MKHTKGPWEVVEERGSRPQIFINGFESGSIAKMYNRMNWQDDARLLAAAPDLLAALKDVLEAFGADGECDCGGSSLCAVCNAQNAIAKAEGVK